MEEAMHFLDGLKDKYLHQVEQAMEDWDFQDFSPDKRCALLDNKEEINERDDQSPEKNTIRKPRESWVGLSPDAKLENYNCSQVADNFTSYEAKLIAVCTPIGGIQGIPDADSVQRLLAQLPRLDAMKVSAAFAERLQDEVARQNWQVRARTVLLMQMLVEIKPFAPRFIPVFQANTALLKQVDALRTSTSKQVIREGARKFLSLIQSNGVNPNLIARTSPTKPHVRHVQMRSADKKKMKTKPTPAVQAQNGVFKPPIMSKATSLVIQHPRPSLVISPKVSQAARASWVRRNSIQKAEEEANLMPFQKIQPPTGSQSVVNHAWMNSGMAPSSITVGGGAPNSSRYDSGTISAFSFVQ
ncbi:hypothetical protein PHYBOEH_003702 [Phytophthora boehmeriae]|uniref:Uncharacterized protein n=1 Tax=Phytophthora boehmeriae TaxID=109152 RepID=A0A8T1WN79_9STRA|nr:hypothetical protein PHYBOEH_003702 [Phytophthora boehmeriae]